MRLPSPKLAVGVLAAFCLVAGSTWWLFRPRPTLDGVAGQIASGRFKTAEERLRAFLESDPGDELARLMLARVLVERPEPAPEAALGLISDLQPADPHRAALARAVEGDAHFLSGRYDSAERAWLEALRLEPTIPEVGWKLLNVLALQGREEDSRRLVLRLFATEPDRRDRVQLLLQLIRHDAHPIEAGSVVHALEPIVKANPGDFRSATALGLALIGTGRADEGLDLLRRCARTREDEGARLAHLNGLVATGSVEELGKTLDELPRPLVDSPRFDEFRGWFAAQSGDLDGAARAYRRALDARPTPPALAYTALAHRFKGVLRQSRREADLAELEPRLEAIINFPVLVRGYFDRLNELPDLGLDSHPDEFEGLAQILKGVGRTQEAEAWVSLASGTGRRSP